MLTKKMSLLFMCCLLCSVFYCKQDQSTSNYSLLGLSGASAGSIDSKHYIEPAGDDSCAGCSGQLSSADAAKLNADLAKNNISNAKIDLNVRVRIPKSANPYSEGDLDLWATVIRPAGSEKLPTILVATPYKREIITSLYLPLVGSRYNLMGIDIRGTGSSPGIWTSFDLLEQYDIKYVVDTYIPSQVWSDGKIGMLGFSYMAIIQMVTAGLVDTDPKTGEPVHLKALFPMASLADAYRDIVMHGGNPDLLFMPMWLGLVDILAIFPNALTYGLDKLPTQEELKEAQAIWKEHWNQIPVNIGWIMDASNLLDGSFYKKKSPMIYWPVKPEGGWGFPEGNRVLSSKLPVFSVGGWFDIFTRGTCNTYQYGLSKHAPTDKKMLIGDWSHSPLTLGMGLNSIVGNQLMARWFDWKIKKKNDPFMEEFPVLIRVMGDDRWRAEKSWPLPESRVEHKTLYLSKHAPTPIPGDWYTDDYTLLQIYANNNYGLSEIEDVSGDNPVLKHDVFSPIQGLNLHGGNSRSVNRWLMGVPSLFTDISKYWLGVNIDAEQWWEDERQDEKECLTFTTEPLENDVEIVGPLALTFWAKTKYNDPLTTETINEISNIIKAQLNIDINLILDFLTRKDVQWVAELNDVFPGGRARNITSGWLLASHRQYDPSGKTGVYNDNGKIVAAHAIDPANVPFDPFYSRPDKYPKLINEGELYQYTVELWPTCNVFKKGHRIRVSLSGSDFPHLGPILTPSRNTIVIDSAHKAKIDFTSTNSDNEGSTWKWIGSNVDADHYLVSGRPYGCGSPASAASYRGTTSGIASEIMGLLAVMILPLSIIIMQRQFRRRKKGV